MRSYRKSHINTFSQGMKSDLDNEYQSKESYRYSCNGSLMLDADGSLAWKAKKGNKESISLVSTLTSEPLVPVGIAEFGDVSIIYSIANADSEIGILILNEKGDGSYKSLLNDSSSTEKLNFSTSRKIEARVYYESDEIIRTYFTEGNSDLSNPFRSFTFRYDSVFGSRSDVNSYFPVTTTVHDVDNTPAADIGIIKFDQLIGGNLLSGLYRYSYRLGTNGGYVTPWMPLTDTFFITTDNISNTNWNEYEMETPGLETDKGIRINIKGIDTRYDYIEVLSVHIVSENSISSSMIFHKEDLTTAREITVDHLSQEGFDEIDSSQINNELVVIDKARTLQIKKNNLYVGNVNEQNINYDIETILDSLTVDVTVREMKSDEKNVSNSFSEISKPITHGSPITSSTVKNLHDSNPESYDIKSDYTNYKGNQVFNLFKGYFRRETYRFGIRFYTKKMSRSLVYHLFDITFPKQYENTATAQRIKKDGSVETITVNCLSDLYFLTTRGDVDIMQDPILDGDTLNLSSGNPRLRVMGLKINGIDLSSVSDDISGFEIVRCKRDASLLMQGLVVPTFKNNNDGDAETNIMPLPFNYQHMKDLNGAGLTGGVVGPDTDEKDFVHVQGGMADGKELENGDDSTLTPDVRSNYHFYGGSVFMSPDIGFSNQIPSLQTNDKIYLEGGCHQKNVYDSGTNKMQTLFNAQTLDNTKDSTESWQKMYWTYASIHLTSNVPYPRFGETIEMENVSKTSPGQIIENFFGPAYNFESDASCYYNGGDANMQGNVNTNNDDVRGAINNSSMVIKHSDFVDKRSSRESGIRTNAHYIGSFEEFANGSIKSPASAGFFIGNYIREKSTFYGGLSLSSLENSLFITIGSFVPVNNSSFTDPSGFIYNGVEVFGGDCYLDYIGMARSYGDMSQLDTTTPGRYALSQGFVFPLESKYCFPLRNAVSDDNPIYSDIGFRDWDGFNSNTGNFINGLFYRSPTTKLLEEFLLQSSLLYEDNLQNGPGIIDVNEIQNRFPTRWRYSPTKINTDPIDVWRQFRANDFKDMTGSYGEITSSSYLFDQIYSFQKYGFSRLRAYDRGQTVDPNLGVLQLGDGTTLDGYDYVNTSFGNQNQFSLLTTSKAIYWCDVMNRTICRFSQNGFEELSKTKNISQYANKILPFFKDKDIPLDDAGISVGYDPYNNRVTWSFNENLNTYENSSGTAQNVVISSYEYFEDNVINMYDFDLVNIIPGAGVTLDFYSIESDLLCVYINPQSDITLLNLDNTTSILTANTTYKVSRSSSSDNFVISELSGLSVDNINSYNGIVYNESLSVFETFLSEKSHLMFTNNGFMVVSQQDSNIMHTDNVGGHGNYFGSTNIPSALDVVVNPSPISQSIFDNIQISIDSLSNDNLVGTELTTNTQYEQLDPSRDSRAAYRENILRFPTRGYSQKDRLRGKYLRVKLRLNTFRNARAKITSLVTKFRTSKRI